MVVHKSLHHIIPISYRQLSNPLHKLQFSHPSIKSSNSIIMSSTNVPTGDVVDDDYKSRPGQSAIPVQSDEAAVEATEYDNGGDSDQQLGMSYFCLRPTLLLTQHREG
jgi:hypothetical protein